VSDVDSDVDRASDVPADAPSVRRRPGAGFRRLYGAGPLHLVAMLLAIALSLYAVTRIRDDPALLKIAVWFVGAALVWDLLLGPALAVVDRLLLPLHRVGALNHVRVPLLASALLLLVWAPAILQRSEGVFRTKAGLSQDVFLGRWLVITAVLCAVSAALYGLRVLRGRRRSA
jgi:hypothetical protein